MEYGRYKVIKSGDVYEVYEYQNYVKFGGKKDKKSIVEDWEEHQEIKTEGEKKTKEELRNYSRTRTRNNIRRQVLANFSHRSKFITLTFADNEKIDIRNVEHTNKEFKKFIQRLRRKYDNEEFTFKYIAVIEFQDKNDRGAVHYHMISNLPYIPNEDLAKLWGLGFVNIRDIKHVDNVGAYISYYINKDVNDSRLDGKKVYLSSKNIIKPREYRGEQAIQLIKNLKLDIKKTVFESSYPSEYCGNITYKEYNMKKLTDKEYKEYKKTTTGKG